MKITFRLTKGSELTHAEHDDNHREAGSLGADVASAATVNLESGVTGRKIKITGTTTISSFGSSAHSGAVRELEFGGALTLAHGASAIVCPWGVDFKTVAGDRMRVLHEGSGKWIVLGVEWASGEMRRFRRGWKAEAASGTSYTADFSENFFLKVQATGNVATVGFTAPPFADAELGLLVRGDGTQRTWGWHSSFVWGSSVAPVMPTATDDYLEIRGVYRGSVFHASWERYGY